MEVVQQLNQMETLSKEIGRMINYQESYQSSIEME